MNDIAQHELPEWTQLYIANTIAIGLAPQQNILTNSSTELSTGDCDGEVIKSIVK